MSGYRDWNGPSDEHEPVTYWRGYPVYATHLIVAVYCVLMVVGAVFGPAMTGVLDALSFSSPQVFSGQVWRIVTYGLFNTPSLWFALDMLMLAWFGRELERHFGRRTFLWLYAGIYLTPPVILTLAGIARPTFLAGEPGTLALFVAFATQFPGMPVFFSLIAKWAALILVGIYALMALAARSWSDLLVLGSTCAFAHGFIRYQQGSWTLPESLPRIRLPKRRPKIRVLKDGPAARPRRLPPSAPAPVEEPGMAEVDSLLDKIGRTGIASLTPAERARLEAARKDLMRRGSGERNR